MWRKNPVLIAGTVVVLILLGAIAWYLGSPLFINRAVDEAFPFDLPDSEQIAAMSETERMALESDFRTAIPGEEELAGLTADQRSAVEKKVMEAAAAMPDHDMDEPMPAGDQPVVVRQGQFMDADSFHRGSGTATIYRLPGGEHTLRFSDFSVTNGPDLHVLLATGTAPADRSSLGDYLDLGSLKGNLGNQNYVIPSGMDPSNYNSVVIYCVPFHVVFATADLR